MNKNIAYNKLNYSNNDHASQHNLQTLLTIIFKRVRTTKTKKQKNKKKKLANDYKNNTVWQLLISIQCKIELKVS